MYYFPRWYATHNTWSPGWISQGGSRWISDPLLVVLIRKFYIAYDLHMDSMSVWVVGSFDTLFKKRRYHTQVQYGFLCFNYFVRKNKEKDVEERGEPLVQFRNQCRGLFKTFKHNTCTNPNALVFTNSTYIWMIFWAL